MTMKTKLYHHLQSTTTKNPQWNTLLREAANKSLFTKALSLYLHMLRSGAFPNAFTFPFAIKSCAALSLPITGKQLHCHVVKSGCLLEPFCSLIDNARQVFDENPQSRNITVCYNSLLSGYALKSRVKDVVVLFCEMRGLGVEINGVTMLGLVQPCGIPGNLGLGMCVHGFCVKFGLDMDSSVGNCLLTMYLFNEMPRKGLITWNAMINGYAQNGLANNVLELYKEMESKGVCPDPLTLVGVLSSCAHLGALSAGKEVERKMEICGFSSNPFLKNALINMYARCGNLEKARDIFDGMPVKSVVSWTAIIGGYGMHGQGEGGIRPDGTAFVSVLSACSHAGLTNKGLDYFGVMERKYGLRPGAEHYSCMVDLLGRAGRLNEARELIESMQVRADGALWGALLGACKIHRNLEPTNTGYYVLLSNVYTEAGNLEGILRVRMLMRERKLKKDPGCSYVEFKGRIHLFFAGDRNHPQINEIYKKLNELENLVKDLDGCKKNDHERREEYLNSMGVHSEKLAVAFALLNTRKETEIIIIKNLRICGDCHLFIKMVSKIVDRQFVVRDATRFHHFKNGFCSCKEYW
ncbi:pentatricopeptide repeat-containing protein [Salix suchowensis]|nr:pentatricopeptide repeat-containing protein [Salix suchowensis]